MSNVIIGMEALKKLEIGIDILSDAVKSTLGPKGKNVVVKTLDTPLITNDGVTIAKSITLEDPIANMGAKLIQQASIKTNELAGDGTTTACVLTQSILKEGIKNITAGANPLLINKGINIALEYVLDELQKMSKPVSTQRDIQQIANISCQDEQIGQLISEGYNQVGKTGVITISESQNIHTTLEIVNGIKIDRGFISTYFCTDMNKEIAECNNPYVIIFDEKIDNFNLLLPFIQHVLTNNSSLIIFADDYTEDVLSALLINKLKAGLKCLPLKSPAYGEFRKQILSDLSIICNTQVLNSNVINNFSPSMLGTITKVISNKYDTTFIQNDTSELVNSRISQLENLLEKTTLEIDKKQIQERISILKGKVAIIKVGAISDIELNERKLRVEDALFACKSAITEGIVIGGGCSLIKIKNKVWKKIKKLDNDIKTGALILLKALESPIRQIAINAGLDAGIIVAKINKSTNIDYGFDAYKNKFGNLKTMGIIDPTKVVRCAIQNAVSVATTVLTTNCVID